MVIEIDPRKEEQLREAAKASGCSVSELVETAIERVIADQTELIQRQRQQADHAAMMADIDRIRELAASEIPDDGFSGRDHDSVIYRKDW